MMNKERCENALYELSIQTEKEVVYHDEINGYVDVLEQLIKEHFNPQPYKFEDLKEDMWVWDRNKCECIKILETYITDDENNVCVTRLKMVRVGHKYRWYDGYDVNFEENRFYPVWMANKQ